MHSAYLVFLTLSFISILPLGQGFDCKNNIDGHYPTPGRCSDFVECVNGKAVGWVCLADHFYDPNNNRCLWPTVRWCTDYYVPTECWQVHMKGLIPTRAADGCKKYIDCFLGIERTCPGETLFNPARRGCDEKYNFLCTE